MRQPLPSTPFCLLLLLLLLPRAASAQLAPMAAYWPHEDGRTWFYDQHAEWPVVTIDNKALLRFEGTTVAPGGVAAQVLTGSVAALPATPASAALAAEFPAAVKSPLLRRLWIARPDLRTGILREAVVAAACPTDAIDGWEGILLSGGFAWVETASEIGAWRCDVVNTQSWRWLIADLRPGSWANLQLIPDLASDVFLRLVVFGLEDVTVPAGTFEDCLRVDYVVDYGTSECVDQQGNPLGTMRHETRGFVRYAPGVGPIESYEEFMVAEATGSCPQPSGPLGHVSFKLNAPSVPAKASSWGRVKAAYRR